MLPPLTLEVVMSQNIVGSLKLCGLRLEFANRIFNKFGKIIITSILIINKQQNYVTLKCQ